MFWVPKKGEYPRRVLRALETDKSKDIINALKNYIPDLS